METRAHLPHNGNLCVPDSAASDEKETCTAVCASSANAPVNGRHHGITAEVTFERVLPSSVGEDVVLEMPGELGYDRADPFAVTLTIFTPGWPVRWSLARDLLLGGCYEPAGEGDVRVEPCLDDAGRAVVLLELSSPHGSAILTTPTAGVMAFLDRVLATVPLGTESDHLDVDEAINRLLQEA